MNKQTDGNKFSSHYRHSIFVEHNGRPYLETVCDNPKALRKLVRMMRQKNPHRTYRTDDPNNP
jgi:hypothetical protein